MAFCIKSINHFILFWLKDVSFIISRTLKTELQLQLTLPITIMIISCLIFLNSRLLKEDKFSNNLLD